MPVKTVPRVTYVLYGLLALGWMLVYVKMSKGSQDRFDAAIEALAANIRFAGTTGESRAIAITSSLPNEGKSTLTVALGNALAKGGRRVCLVEGDLRRPTVGRMLGCSPTCGIGSVLVGDATLDDALVPTGQARLFLLDGETDIANPADLFATQSFKKVLRTLKRRFDYVIVDTPPLHAVVDAAVIAAAAGDAVLVVREGRAARGDVRSSYDQLRKAGAHVLGTVVNYDSSRVGS